MGFQNINLQRPVARFRPLNSTDVAEEPRVSVIRGEAGVECQNRAGFLGINWLIYLPIALLAGALLVPPIKAYFSETGWRWIHVMALSFSLSFSVNPFFAAIARKLNILDLPDARKCHQEATPLLGGASVFFGFGVSLLVNGIFSIHLGVILISALILFVIGVLDDFKEVSAGIKLVSQIGCSLLVMSTGIVLRVIPTELGILAVVLNALLTVCWIIGVTNAMNFFDGMDGLAAGMGAMIAFFLCVVAFQTSQPFLGWISVAMMGGCLGFLPYNFKFKGSATIFLGDAGSTIIGFVLACVAVYGDWAEGDPIVALISPILIFWILIFDMIHITVDRILTGKVLNFRQWIEYVGRDHLHHRLAHVLGSKKRSVLFIYMMSLCLGISAVSLRNASAVDAVLLIFQAVIIVLMITILERRGRLTNRDDIFPVSDAEDSTDLAYSSSPDEALHRPLQTTID